MADHNQIDLTLLQRDLVEIKDQVANLTSSGDGDSMDPWQTSVENRLVAIDGRLTGIDARLASQVGFVFMEGLLVVLLMAPEEFDIAAVRKYALEQFFHPMLSGETG